MGCRSALCNSVPTKTDICRSANELFEPDTGLTSKTASLYVSLPLLSTPEIFMDCYRRRTWGRRTKQEEVFRKVIWPAIRGHSCPICFRDLELHYREAAVLTVCMHAYCVECIRKWSGLKRKCPLCNSEFNSCFCRLSLSSRSFQEEAVTLGAFYRNSEKTGGNQVEDARRILHRTRIELNNRRTRAIPWRRSFGRHGLVSPDVISQRRLEWRASIYNHGLQAVPPTLTCPEQNNRGNIVTKEKILLRIEPWIRRELQAVLADPDPTVIVHVVTSQFIAWLEEKSKLPSGELDVEDSFISPLYPFLHDRARIFWHELRCFAESSYNMETYDAIVEYKQQE